MPACSSGGQCGLAGPEQRHCRARRLLPCLPQVQRQQAVRPAAARRMTTKAISDVNLVVGGA